MKTAEGWSNHNIPRFAAALSFYAVLSLAPVLVLAVAVASIFLGDESSARSDILHLARSYVGDQGIQFLSTLIDNARSPKAWGPATLISLIVTFFSASNLFLQLEDSVNAIWGIQPKGSIIRNFLVSRISAVLAVLAFGAVLMAWLAFDSWLGWLHAQTGRVHLWNLVSLVVSIPPMTLIFAVAFKALPRNTVSWGDVWIAAFVTALGFALSKLILGLYFRLSSVSSAYGAAGALVLVLLWIYYMAQIYFFGVEMTHAHATLYGSHAEKKVLPQ